MEAGLPPVGDQFEYEVLGTYGRFITRSGAMSFIQTRARVGPVSGADTSARLMRHLRPFREVIPPETLDFSQVLQRDIDDYRVAHQLVPYLLSQRPGPAFFPPILTVLLPFTHNEPTTTFPSSEEVTEGDGAWRGLQYGEAFKTQQLYAGDNPHDYSIARLKWNGDFAKLVVLDGQHRCMAMLAIDRTHRNSWADTATGAPYKQFYEPHVKRLLENEPDVDAYLQGLEVPVTVAWFEADYVDPSRAARQLFVDVNKTAKPPSDSRLILLSDSDLKRVFTRSLLDHAKDDGYVIPHYAIEHDNPAPVGGKCERWSAIVSLTLLEHAVNRCVVESNDTWLTDCSLGAFGGGFFQQADRDEKIRKAITLADFLTDDFDVDGAQYSRDEVGQLSFPLPIVDTLVKAFMETWGRAILEIIGDTLPFRAHHDALVELNAEWEGGDEANRLARTAMFDGSGVYWTLKRTNELAAQDDAVRQTMATLLEAWMRVSEWGEVFDRSRATKLFPSCDESEALAYGGYAYQVFTTHACQLGAIVTFASLAELHDVKGDELPDLATEVVKLWNKAMLESAPGGAPRQLAFARKQPTGQPVLNRITDLNARRALLYRYLWLEMLGTQDLSESNLDQAVVDAAINGAREPYFKEIARSFKKEARDAHPEWNASEVNAEADTRAQKHLKTALSYWFGGDDGISAWFAARQSADVQVADTATPVEDDHDGPENSLETDEGEEEFVEDEEPEA